MPIEFKPTFDHSDWINNLNRVNADEFNARFQALKADLGVLQNVVKAISDALAILGQAPQPTDRVESFSPVLMGLEGAPWIQNIGYVQRRGADAGNPNPGAANGIMAVSLPGGGILTEVRAQGTN